MELNSPLILRKFTRFNLESATVIGGDDFVFDAPGVEAVACECDGIILEDGDEQRATTLLLIGAPRVFIGEAALRDSTIIRKLVEAHGGERIGIYAPLQRQAVSWSFETVSNADFKTVTPSHCEPAWEVLRANGTSTGTLAVWWLCAMRDLGATQFLVRTSLHDDTDLNLCADLVERFADSVWISAPAEADMPFADWVEYGQGRQWALSDDLIAEAISLKTSLSDPTLQPTQDS